MRTSNVRPTCKASACWAVYNLFCTSREELNQNPLLDTTRLFDTTYERACSQFISVVLLSQAPIVAVVGRALTELRRHFCQAASNQKNPYKIQDFTALNRGTQCAAHINLDLNKFQVW